MLEVIQAVQWKGWDLKLGLFDSEDQGIKHFVIVPRSRKVSFHDGSVRSFVSLSLTLWFTPFNFLLLFLLESTSQQPCTWFTATAFCFPASRL